MSRNESEKIIHPKQIATVILSVSDQDRALAFYTDVLGMEKRADVPFGDGDRWIEVAPPGAATTLAFGRPPTPPTGRGATCVSFEVDDVAAAHAALRARGVDVDETVMRAPPPVPPMFFFRDPDGNPLLFVERAK